MGADLYLQPLNDKCEKSVKEQLGIDPKANLWELGKNLIDKYIKSMDEHRKRCYFRDSYNDSSILWRLGLSWWQDVGKLTDKNGYLQGKNLLKFIKMVENAKFKPFSLSEWMKMDKSLTREKAQQEVKEYNKYLREKRKQLILFLKSGTAKDCYIECSI